MRYQHNAVQAVTSVVDPYAYPGMRDAPFEFSLALMFARSEAALLYYHYLHWHFTLCLVGSYTGDLTGMSALVCEFVHFTTVSYLCH